MRWVASILERKSGRRWVSALIRKVRTVTWDQCGHRNSILHERDCAKQRTLITYETDRLGSRQFAIAVQELPSTDHYLFQEPIKELLKAPMYVHKQWLASTTPSAFGIYNRQFAIDDASFQPLRADL
jgi:hypothetical protein